MNDKVQHVIVGIAILVFTGAFWLIFGGTLSVMFPLATTVGGLAKEGADWLDNKASPGMHEVSLLDALATAAPGYIAGFIAHSNGL